MDLRQILKESDKFVFLLLSSYIRYKNYCFHVCCINKCLITRYINAMNITVLSTIYSWCVCCSIICTTIRVPFNVSLIHYFSKNQCSVCYESIVFLMCTYRYLHHINSHNHINLFSYINTRVINLCYLCDKYVYLSVKRVFILILRML